MEVANWYGHDYAGEQAMRTEVASLLASKIYYLDGSEYKSLTEADLKLVPGVNAPAGADVKAYEVFFQLSDSGLARNWYVYSSAAGYTGATTDEINAQLAEVEPAMVYKDGMTYYSTDIRHMGSEGSASEYGVVRNHIYKINISDVKGLGTPVYDQDIDIDTPERPVDKHSYIAAQVRILSWKVVKNDYSVE